jgi:hypothetical protein
LSLQGYVSAEAEDVETGKTDTPGGRQGMLMPTLLGFLHNERSAGARRRTLR